MYEYKLPDIGEGLSEAELIEWSVSEGDTVKEGDPVCEIDTDKVSVDLPAPVNGRVAELRWQPGDVIPVGQVLMVFEVDPTPGSRETQDGDALSSTVAQGAPGGSAGARGDGQGKRESARLGRVVAAPSTRRFAAEQGVDLHGVEGSGPGGRILQADVEAVLARTTAERTADASLSVSGSTAPPAPASDQDTQEVHREKPTGARAVAVERMAHSARTAATSTTTFEVDGGGQLTLLARLAEEADRRHVRLSPVALLSKCIAAALLEHPRFNARIDEEQGELILHKRVDLGVAVAAQSGLVVPVVRAADKRGLFDVAAAITSLAERAHEGLLRLDDVQGGTFTLSSTGGLEESMIESTTPLINPPQTAILWAGRIVDRPCVAHGELTVRPRMRCSVSFDHRFIDGADLTRFINDLTVYLEQPERAIT